MSTFPSTDLRPPLPTGTFEAHVTVAAPDDETLRRFTGACAGLGVEPVYIELARGEARFQPMTSSHHRGTLADARREVEALAAALSAGGLRVTRVKIEAVGDNPLVPRTDEDAAARAFGYFEFHVKIALPEARAAEVRALSERLGAHLSRNARKPDGEGALVDDGGLPRSSGALPPPKPPVRFVTLRVPGAGRAAAEARFTALLAELRGTGLPLFHPIREYTVYDSNADLDRGWLSS